MAGLVASTADMSSQDFMAGRGDFALAGRAGARIVNAGEISVRDGGLAALVAPGVENSGTISARLGRVQLASGETFTLDMYGDDLIRIGVSGATLGAIVNTGRISADGGVIEITARSGAAAVNSLINMGGVVEARSAGVENGAVVFYGADDGVVQVTGTVDVSGRDAGETGGVIKVLGEKVALTGNATLDASGDAGGGVILIGGDYQGQGDTPTASRTLVTRDVSITTDAITSGDAGKAIVWADGDTRYYGAISAKGGAQSGDGGTVEVSGKHNLDFDGKVDTSAPNGQSGTLLLDPDFILIRNAGGGTDDAQIADGSIAFGDGGAATFNISETALAALTGNITLQANNKITIVNLDDDELTLGASGLIKFEAGAGGFEMLDANDLIHFTGGGSLKIDTTTGPGADGTIITGRIALGPGSATIKGGSVIIGSAISTISGNVDIFASQAIAINAAVNSGGNISFSAEDSINVNADMSAAGFLYLDGDFSSGSGGGVTFADGVTLQASSFLELSADNSGSSNISGVSDIWALGNLTLKSSSNLVDLGDVVHANGTLTIIAKDVNIAAAIEAGGQTLLIEGSFGDTQLGANNAAATMNIDNTELAHITTSTLLINSTGDITVEGIAATDTNSISSFVELFAAQNLKFANAASTFTLLFGYAESDIVISSDLTLTGLVEPGSPSLYLTANFEGVGSGNLTVMGGATVQTTTPGAFMLLLANDLIMDNGFLKVPTSNGGIGVGVQLANQVIGIGTATGAIPEFG